MFWLFQMLSTHRSHGLPHKGVELEIVPQVRVHEARLVMLERVDLSLLRVWKVKLNLVVDVSNEQVVFAQK